MVWDVFFDLFWVSICTSLRLMKKWPDLTKTVKIVMKSKVGQPEQTGQFVKNMCKKGCKNLWLGGVHSEVILGSFFCDFGTLLRQVGGPDIIQKSAKKR